MDPETVLITGGSSGIGFSLAKLFAGDGYRLILVALGEPALDAAAMELRQRSDAEVVTLDTDLTRRHAPKAVYESVRARGLNVDVLVNCAGFASHGSFQTIELDRDYDMVLVNCAALMAMTKLIYPLMLARDKGKILNMCSTIALQPTPNMAVYAATKAFVNHFSLALSEEARGLGANVTITTVYPYATRTNFEFAAGMTGHRLFHNPLTLDPDRVAAAAYRAMQSGRFRLILPRIGGLVFDVLYRLMTERSKMALVKWGMRP